MGLDDVVLDEGVHSPAVDGEVLAPVRCMLESSQAGAIYAVAVVLDLPVGLVRDVPSVLSAHVWPLD